MPMQEERSEIKMDTIPVNTIINRYIKEKRRRKDDIK
jgi:hypothetical protein